MSLAEDLDALVALLPAPGRVGADVHDRAGRRRRGDDDGMLGSLASQDVEVFEVAEEEPREVEVVDRVLEQPVAHVEAMRERSHRPRERAERQGAELGLLGDLLRDAICAGKALHVADHDGHARLRRFVREQPRLGGVVRGRLLREHRDAAADAHANHVEELIGRHDDHDAVGLRLVQHALDVVERPAGAEPRADGLRALEVPRARRRESHARDGDVRQDRVARVRPDADRTDPHQSCSYALSTDAVPRSRAKASA